MAVHTAANGAATGAGKQRSDPSTGENPAQCSQLENEEEEFLKIPPPTPVLLSEKALHFHSVWGRPEHESVPPCTPNSEFQFESTFQPLPAHFPAVADLNIPSVRSSGVKRCIEQLAEGLHCTDYKFNLLHFWFLDVITDCIWRAQDQFEFPPEQQKTILSWLLFVFDLIRDPSKNFSKNEFFAVFKEAVLVAAEVLEEGAGVILDPLTLVRVRNGGSQSESAGSEETSKSSESTITESSTSTSVSRTPTCSDLPSKGKRDPADCESLVEFQVGGETVRYPLDHESCHCSDMGDSLPLSFERMLEEQTEKCASLDDYPSLAGEVEGEGEGEWSDVEEAEVMDGDWDIRDFYQPDKDAPERFLPLSASQELFHALTKTEDKKERKLKEYGPVSDLAILQLGQPIEKKSLEKLTDYIIFRKRCKQRTEEWICEKNQSEPDDKNIDDTNATSKSEPETTESENTRHEKIMKGLRKYKLMEQRVRDFSDSNVGLDEWQMSKSKSGISNGTSVSREPENAGEEREEDECVTVADEELEGLMAAEAERTQELEEKEFLSFGVLWAIIDFVYEYFSDNFQYTLIKMALTAQPNLIVQKLNDEWRTPKDLKEDLTVFVKDLKDKYKRIILKKNKDKKDTKSKKDKKSKSDKSSKKSSKKNDKSEKTGKSKKSDKKSKDAKEKKNKQPPTEEELLFKQQQAELEAERLRQEMNKKFLFPLQDAIDDEFFMTKFQNWKKVDWRKGNGKGDKSPKKK